MCSPASAGIPARPRARWRGRSPARRAPSRAAARASLPAPCRPWRRQTPRSRSTSPCAPARTSARLWPPPRRHPCPRGSRCRRWKYQCGGSPAASCPTCRDVGAGPTCRSTRADMWLSVTSPPAEPPLGGDSKRRRISPNCGTDGRPRGPTACAPRPRAVTATGSWPLYRFGYQFTGSEALDRPTCRSSARSAPHGTTPWSHDGAPTRSGWCGRRWTRRSTMAMTVAVAHPRPCGGRWSSSGQDRRRLDPGSDHPRLRVAVLIDEVEHDRAVGRQLLGRPAASADPWQPGDNPEERKTR